MAASPKKKKRHPVAIAFGVALRASRIRANRTQEALGLSCGLDRTYVSLLERGINQPTLGTILLLADELETSAEGLVTETRKALGQAGARQEVASRGQGAAARHKAAGPGRGTAQRSRTKGRARPKSARS